MMFTGENSKLVHGQVSSVVVRNEEVGIETIIQVGTITSHIDPWVINE